MKDNCNANENIFVRYENDYTTHKSMAENEKMFYTDDKEPVD